MGNKQSNIKIVGTNRRAGFDYALSDKFEAGMVLTGCEVKSLREGKVNLKDSYAHIKNGEIFLLNCHISPYVMGNRYNPDPVRSRKLLLHKQEINKLVGKTVEKGLTLIPLKIYFSHGKAKVEIAIGKGKKNYDKREDIKSKDAEREMRRELREKIK